MLWLLLLPLRLAVGLLLGIVLLPIFVVLLPFALLLWLPFVIVRAALRLVVLPIVFVVLVVGMLVAGLGLAFAILVPLLPLALVAFCVWAIMRRSQAATVVRG